MDLRELDWPRRTARLELRPARVSDADEVWRFRRLPEVGEWLSQNATDEGDHRQRWALQVDDGVVALLDGRVVATGKVHVEDGWGQAEVASQTRSTQAELGWVLDPAISGRGYGTELAAELLAIAWGLGVRRVVALAFADNVASTRIMEKIGMRREGLYRKESLHRTRGWLDGVTYAVLREDVLPD